MQLSNPLTQLKQKNPKVRYFGEPVAVVVANTEQEAAYATKLIEIEYESSPVINSIQDVMKKVLY